MNSTFSSTVPNVNLRQRIPQQAIDQIVLQIAEKFLPQRIILFGSYAKDTPRPESDLDILVIMKTPLRETEQAIQIRQELNVLFGLDLLVYTPDNLTQRLEWGDSFLKEITESGTVVYESINA